MKQHKRLLVALGFSAAQLYSLGQNNYLPHSFNGYSSVNLIQLKDAYHKNAPNDNNDQLQYITAAGQYNGSFNTCRLGAMPFWSETNTMTIGTNDGESNVDAYQFGMGNVTRQGAITLTPSISQFGVDVQWFWMRHAQEQGAIFKLDLPLAATRSKMCIREAAAELENNVIDNWTPPYPAVADRPTTLTQAFQGGSVSLGTLNSCILKPIALYRGKLSCCPLTTIRLADVAFTAGYNIKHDDKGMLMLGFKVSCPTGNVPTGTYIFEPIVGRGGHWGIGLELSGDVKLRECEDSKMRLWFQGEILHLFSGRKPSYRSFDLTLNGPGSKYLLLQYYTAQNPSSSNEYGYIPSFITQAVNVTTFPVRSTFPVEGSLAIMLDWEGCNNVNFAVGGEVWGRSRERLCIDYCSAINYNSVNLNNYAVLGRQISNTAANGVTANLCEPLATISKSQDTATAATSTILDATNPENRIPANVEQALNICGAQIAKALTGKVFGEVGYGDKENANQPYVALFGGAEFTSKGCSQVSNMYSIGLKGSFVF